VIQKDISSVSKNLMYWYQSW